MPRPADHESDDFEIHVDKSCLNSPMDEQPATSISELVEPPVQPEKTAGDVGPASVVDKIPAPDDKADAEASKADESVGQTQPEKETAAEASSPPEAADAQEAPNHAEDTRQGTPADDVKAEDEENHAEPEADPSIGSATGADEHSRRESGVCETSEQADPAESFEGDAGGDSSSQQENDDDVFSDHSPRSSMGSIDMDGGNRKPQGDDDKSQAGGKEYTFDHGRPARASGISDFSTLESQLDEDDVFVPETRGTPRHPFRTTSAMRAMQMTSPTASVFSTPPGGGKLPSAIPHHSASRLGSPGVSAQYSPKGRSTPTRFKVKKEPAPLVLLHATLLPLRWTWADVLDEGFGMPAENGSEAGCFKASEDLKRLRDNWKELQDRMGDTVLERGILLSHPQSDYEVLEERLLEALELPMRRRARILECGHYLGPSNINSSYAESSEDDTTTDESEDDYAATPSRHSRRRNGAGGRETRHWCGMCKSDIKYEALGPGKIFRVKIYASNGLMRAGAWEACWKEMERVDAEVEPVVEPSLQLELERLEAWQAAEHQKREEELDRRAQEEYERRSEEEYERHQEGEELDPRTDEDLMAEAEAHLAAAEAEAAAHEAQFGDTTDEHDDDDVEHELHEEEEMHGASFEDQTEIIHPPSTRASSPTEQRESTEPQDFEPSAAPADTPSSPVQPHQDDAEDAEAAATATDIDIERRRRDEERLREIYGHSPPGTSGRDSLDFSMLGSRISSPAPGPRSQSVLSGTSRRESLLSNNHEGQRSTHRDSLLSSPRGVQNPGSRRDSIHSNMRDGQQQARHDESMGLGEDSFLSPETPVSPSLRGFDRRSPSARSMRVALQDPHAPRPSHPLRQGSGLPEEHPLHHDQQPHYPHDPSHPHQQPAAGYPHDQRPRRRGDESLTELLLEAANVLMRDRKNVAIAALGFLVLLFALRSPSSAAFSYGHGGMSMAEREAEIMRTLYVQQQLQIQQQQYHHQQQQQQQQQQRHQESAVMPLPAEPVGAMGSSPGPVVEIAQTVTEPASEIPNEDKDSSEAAPGNAEPKVEAEVVKVYETVTETVKVTATDSLAEETPAATPVEAEAITETMTAEVEAETEAGAGTMPVDVLVESETEAETTATEAETTATEAEITATEAETETEIVAAPETVDQAEATEAVEPLDKMAPQQGEVQLEEAPEEVLQSELQPELQEVVAEAHDEL